MKKDIIDFINDESCLALNIPGYGLRIGEDNSHNPFQFFSSRDNALFESIKTSSMFADKRRIFQKVLSGNRLLSFKSPEEWMYHLVNVSNLDGWAKTNLFDAKEKIEAFEKKIHFPKFTLNEVLQHANQMTYQELKEIDSLTKQIMMEIDWRSSDIEETAKSKLIQMNPKLSEVQKELILANFLAYGPITYALNNNEVSEVIMEANIMKGIYKNGSEFVFHYLSNDDVFFRSKTLFWAENMAADLQHRLNEAEPLVCRYLQGIGIVEISLHPASIRFVRTIELQS